MIGIRAMIGKKEILRELDFIKLPFIRETENANIPVVKWQLKEALIYQKRYIDKYCLPKAAVEVYM